jgi:hypothetical protein
MFHITGNFQRGVYDASSNKINGFQVMSAQFSSDADKLIKAFEAAIKAGYNPNDNYVQIMVFNAAKVNINDLDDFNIKRVKRKVEKIWESKQNGL